LYGFLLLNFALMALSFKRGCAIFVELLPRFARLLVPFLPNETQIQSKGLELQRGKLYAEKLPHRPSDCHLATN